ncbi:hypothetical protein HBA55_34865 [Pseudomaricurvus alkylphenolicus]|uniref:hypothetical protein n=1 Tax=Pseudomaricurvus alkylphenolicus TaxID=1306991 RepID=UPI00142272F0|nr:hypothetical protein [Pseudomaricurvus alkylphenolicus]NIB44815.1 hypothetical protein [Pseudomaricurvus alkylphenolicus]
MAWANDMGMTMFVFTEVDQIKKKVSFKVPGDLDKETKADLLVTYRVLELEDAEEVLKDFREGNRTEEQILSENILDIEGMMDKDKNKIPFSDDMFQKLMARYYVRKALVDKMLEVFFGKEVLKAKN